MIAWLAAAAVTAITGTGPQVDRDMVFKLEEKVAYATSIAEGLSCVDPAIVQDDFFPPQRRGLEQVKQDFAVYMSDYSGFKAHIDDISIDVQGDLAVAYSHQHFTAPGKDGVPNLDAEVRQTDVLRKRDGRWLITYQHLSVPIDLRTGKAVFGR